MGGLDLGGSFFIMGFATLLIAYNGFDMKIVIYFCVMVAYYDMKVTELVFSLNEDNNCS
jgi:hypothetical protein